MMNQALTILIALEKDDQALEHLHDIYPDADIRIGPWINNYGQTMSASLMKGVDALLCEVPPDNFDDFDQLKWIQLTSSGYEQVLKLPILERDIRVANGLGNFDIAIAEWNIMMILMWHRNMLKSMEHKKHKLWQRGIPFQAELRGSTVGFYGYGGFARQTARIAKAMGLTVWAMTRDGKIKNRNGTYCVEGVGDQEGRLPDKVFGPDEKEAFMGGLDYLVIAMPLTPQTTGIIGEKELRMLKPSAVLINSARAPLIDEQAYLKCLREGWIRGSALDVHYAYPLPPDHPLWDMPNLIMTPHIAGSDCSTNFRERIYDIFTRNLARFCAGSPLLNELSEDQLRGE